MTGDAIRQACVLVGGKGSRLGPLTHDIPKPLLEIGGGKVFLDLVIAQLARSGFTDIVLLAGYLGDKVRARYDGFRVGGASIRVVVEREPRGTAGALLDAREVLAPRFLMLNGDSFFDIDLAAFAAAASEGPGAATIALRYVEDTARYGSVTLDGERITRFVEKSKAAGPGPINAGLYVVPASIVETITSLPCSIEADIFPRLAHDGRLFGKICTGYFIDIGLPETLSQARLELAAMLGESAEATAP